MKKLHGKNFIIPMIMASLFSFSVLTGTWIFNDLPFSGSKGNSDSNLVAYAAMSNTVGNDKVPSNGTAETLRGLDPDDIASLACYNSSDFDIVTSIKDQEDLPWCWAYGVTSAAETNILRKGILNRYINGKEFNINTYNTVYHVYNDSYNSTSKYSKDPLDNNPVVSDFVDIVDNNGNAQAPVLQLLSQWKGAVNDATNDGTEYSYNNQAANLRNAYRLNKNVDVIKKAIATYGGVSIPYDTAFDDGYVYVNNGTVDHLVELVGWDDSITPDQFPLTRKPTSNGAFIGKNSWGDDMFDIDGDGKGDSGYFYLSYESTMGSANAVEFMPVATYDNLYYYDGGVETLESNIYTYVNNSVTAANIYQVKKPNYNVVGTLSNATNVTNEETQTLRAVQVGIEQYASGIPISVTIEIYKGLSPDTTSVAYCEANNPRSGELVTTQTASVQYGGYHTIDLAEPVTLNVGDWFSVVVTVSDDLGSASILKDNDKGSYNDRSYYWDGNTWNTLTSSMGSNYGSAARIKALTVNGTKTYSDISDAKINLANNTYVYNGTTHTPVTTVTMGNTILKENVDYAIRYENNLQVGQAKVVITGLGNYAGEAYATYMIEEDTRMDLSGNETKITFDKTGVPFTYDGEEHKPKVLSVTYNNKQLTENVDYTLAYANASIAGSATITVSAKEGSNYKGKKQVTYTINKADINDAQITLSPPSYTYSDGKSYKPDVTVTFNGKVLVEQLDYKALTYTNNTSTGTGTVTIDADTSNNNPNFTGKVEVDYAILGPNMIDLNSTQTEVTLEKSEYPYTRNEIKPEVISVKYNGTTLTSGTDYTISYVNNIDMGTAYVKVTGKGIYAGSKLAEFTITSPENRLTIDYVIVPNTSYTYTGEEIIPNYSAWYIPYVGAKRTEWVELTENKDYTVEITDNIFAGTGKIKVTGIGIYTGENNYTFTIDKAKPLTTPKNKTISYDQTISSIHWETGWSINGTTPIIQAGETANVELIYFDTENYSPYTATVQVTREAAPTDAKSLSNATITLATSNYTYTGNIIEPDVTVSYDGTILQKDNDYSVSYSNNINVGAATITITGKGDYYGSKQITFKIEQADLSTATITIADGNLVYNGLERKPSVTVKLGDKTLVKDTDYSVSYQNNINVGQATVIIAGIGNYSGNASEKFSISKASVVLANITLSNTSYVYDGTAKQPNATVVVENKTLKLNTDYTIDYSANTSVGTATVTITGIGNYAGTATATFEITQIDIDNATITLPQDGYQFVDGSEYTPEPTVTYNNVVLVNGKDYSVNYTANTSVGTATVTITGIGNYKGTKQVYFTIYSETQIMLSSCTYSNILSYVYTGNQITPTVVVTDGDYTLVENTDYIVSYSNNTNAGTAKIIVSGKGATYVGNYEIEFTIEKDEKPQNAPVSEMKVGKDVNLATIDWGDGWSYVSSNILADGSTEVLLEYSDKVNYNNYTATVIVTTLSEKPDELETPEVPDELETPTEPTVPEAPSQNEENNADDPASIAMKVVAIALVALVAGAGIFILANFIISKKKKH